MSRNLLNSFKSDFSALAQSCDLAHRASCVLEHEIGFIYENDRNETWKLIMIFDHGNRHYLYSKCDDEAREGHQIYRMRLISFALTQERQPAFVLSDRHCTLLEAMAHVTNYIMTDDLAIHN